MTKKNRKAEEKQLRRSKPTRSLSPFEEMERLFEGWHPGGWLHPFHRDWPSPGEASVFGGKTPSIDLIDRDNAIIVKAELPGVDKKDVDISVTKNSVSIKGTTSHEEKEEKGDYYRSEISRGEYARTLTLPAEIDEEKVKATFKNGILELNLPKLVQSARKTVEIE